MKQIVTANQVKKDLQKYINKEKAAFFPRFFKTGKGEYGEGDRFIGVIVPNQRKVAKAIYKDISLREVKKLLSSPIHEHRLTASFILVYKFAKADETGRKEIYGFYIKNRKGINNWDIVDTSTPHIVGAYLKDQKDRKILYKFAKSKDLWERRIAMLACYAFIKNGEEADTIKIAKILMQDKHDLIHKAVGWMLRELWKVKKNPVEKFLNKHHKTMPRTMLRYAIEKMPEMQRKRLLNK